jgi:lactoylglutathione lyase
MKFGYTIIYVPDVESTIMFYKKAFGIDKHFLHESKQYGQLDTGETKLAFASESLAQSNGVEFVKNDCKNLPAGFEIALVTPDVDAGYKQALAAGAIALKEPAQKPWGQTVAYVRDCNGIIVEICTPIE